MSGVGALGAAVWPPYVGLTTQDPGPPGSIAMGEPVNDLDYSRGMITWRTENGQVYGAANITVPKGIYTHIVFFSGPYQANPLMDANKLEHPFIAAKTMIIEINPIQHGEYLPR